MRRVRRIAAVGLLGSAAALAGCGSGGPAPGSAPTSAVPVPTPAARAELAARAAAAQDLAGVMFYSLHPPGEPLDPATAPPETAARTVMVVRAGDGSWRVDVPGGALGGTLDVSVVSTGDGLHHCTTAGCVALDALPPEADPRVQHVFTDWLDVLTDRSAALSAFPVPAPAGVTGDCFAVQSSAASLLSPVDPGVYCYQVDGTLTGAALDFGTLRLTGPGGSAPPSVALPGPVVPGPPQPTASPTPPPTLSASPSPGASRSP